MYYTEGMESQVTLAFLLYFYYSIFGIGKQTRGLILLSGVS